MKKTALIFSLFALLLSAALAIAGEVSRAQFTTAVDAREPADDLSEAAAANTQKIYFFTELRDLEGQTVTHRWTYNGNTMAEVSFTPGSARWRVWSSKELLPDWTGTWTVAVVDAGGTVLTEKSFEYK
ncbi:MAG: DUF2914 domain-containing protein [Gammaproteobacteria bacterium]|nr:DUF2914 domain-containing protein [Gammaproteobacteria bacterium]